MTIVEVIMFKPTIAVAFIVTLFLFELWSWPLLGKKMQPLGLLPNVGTAFMFIVYPALLAVMFLASLSSIGGIIAVVLQLVFFGLIMLGWYSHLGLHYQNREEL